MAITPLPTPPLRSDPSNFANRADAFLGALPTFVTEANALAAAMNLNSTTDGSASSVAIGTGAKAFEVTAGKSWQKGMYLVIADATDPGTNSMFGQVTAYVDTTLTVNVLSVRGSGTKSAWVISQSAPGGAALGNNNDITKLLALTDVPAVVATAISANSHQISGISASVAANALTVDASTLSLDFRSTTLSSGGVTRVTGDPSSLVVPSGASLGSVSGWLSEIMVLAINNAGTIELAVVNLAGGTDLSETGLISTTAISAAATANNVVYSTTARANVAYRVIGIVRSIQATAGTWATAPSLVQGQGGQALAAMQSLGYGQNWQDFTASRALGVTYYNTSGKPIAVNLVTQNIGISNGSRLTVNGVTLYGHDPATATAGFFMVLTVPVPPGASYSARNFNQNLVAWNELR